MINDSYPPILTAIQSKCEELGFDMASDEKAGSMLRTLVASKPGGRFLELGTGIGASLCWMLDGMDQRSSIISIDNDPELTETARSFFKQDSRVSLVCQDGESWIKSYQGQKFDLIFADAWPGKYSCLDQALNLVKPSGFYVIDDMLPQPNWPEGHAAKVEDLLEYLSLHHQLHVTRMNWSTGVVICTRK